MLQNQTLTKKPLKEVGEEIGLELGLQMVKDYQVANPADVHYYIIGKNIINQILAQPHCVGIKLLNAYNENGEKTLVYVGVNSIGKSILSYTSVNSNGKLAEEKGIVADRIRTGTGDRTGDRSGILPDADDWGWIAE